MSLVQRQPFSLRFVGAATRWRAGCRSPAVLGAAVAAPEEPVLVGGRAGGDVKRERASVLLAGAVDDPVEREASAPDTATLSQARMAGADWTRLVPAVAPEPFAAPVWRRLLGARVQRQLSPQLGPRRARERLDAWAQRPRIHYWSGLVRQLTVLCSSFASLTFLAPHLGQVMSQGRAREFANFRLHRQQRGC